MIANVTVRSNISKSSPIFGGFENKEVKFEAGDKLCLAFQQTVVVVSIGW